MAFEQILTGIKASVGTLTLNRPDKKNALSIRHDPLFEKAYGL